MRLYARVLETHRACIPRPQSVRLSASNCGVPPALIPVFVNRTPPYARRTAASLRIVHTCSPVVDQGGPCMQHLMSTMDDGRPGDNGKSRRKRWKRKRRTGVDDPWRIWEALSPAPPPAPPLPPRSYQSPYGVDPLVPTHLPRSPDPATSCCRLPASHSPIGVRSTTAPSRYDHSLHHVIPVAHRLLPPPSPFLIAALRIRASASSPAKALLSASKDDPGWLQLQEGRIPRWSGFEVVPPRSSIILPAPAAAHPSHALGMGYTTPLSMRRFAVGVGRSCGMELVMVGEWEGGSFGDGHSFFLSSARLGVGERRMRLYRGEAFFDRDREEEAAFSLFAGDISHCQDSRRRGPVPYCSFFFPHPPHPASCAPRYRRSDVTHVAIYSVCPESERSISGIGVGTGAHNCTSRRRAGIRSFMA
ncbi:hypothetical protein R3P38DRAFT_3423952 [Favolaschia claudopus]|uniref:Uncharacterized protein n=1 Tax=Favolaschia claudopus TaxID=2862362 RepID=A0AAV9ZXY9_9AGAR